MAVDSNMPLAPSRVRALVLPIGQIKRERFAAFVSRLNDENVVQLRDITADGRPNRNMFSPLAFPDGAIFYDLTTHMPSPSHMALSPFDLYRTPLVLLAVADGAEIGQVPFTSKRLSSAMKRQSTGRNMEEINIRTLDQDLEALRDTYDKMLVHRVLIFDYAAAKDPVPIPEGIVTIPPADQLKRTTMKTVMCDTSSLLLAEMNTLARSFEAFSLIDSPGQASFAHHHTNGSSMGADDMNPLSRRSSQHGIPGPLGVRSSSATGLTDRGAARMSMPPGSLNSLVGTPPIGTPGRPVTPVGGKSKLSNPPTTFDDIGHDPMSPERPGTAEGFRTQSQDRMSIQGFGSGGASERWRNKGRSRVQIIQGSLYLQAGRWPDAVRELTEGAVVAKSVNDHIWHGKALELLAVALILLGWAGVEFQIPVVLLPPTADGRASVTAAAGQDDDRGEAGQPQWMRRLQVLLPELFDRIITLYSRVSAEHLPPLPLSEAIIRFAKVLTAIHVADGKIRRESLDMIVLGIQPPKSLNMATRYTIVPTRIQITTLLFRAFPASGSDLLTTIDRASVLSGIGAVLGVLGFHRKKAMVVRELVSILIGGLVEARTRGAADVGIHPAAGLAILNGMQGVMNGHAGGAGTLELAHDDIEIGMSEFLGILMKVYGVVGYDVRGCLTDAVAATASPADEPSPFETEAATLARIQRHSVARSFGMTNLKLNILRACINFCEALPDFAGVLRFSSDLLRSSGRGIAPGPRREDASPAISREEQARLLTNISKTTNLADRLGIHGLAADYWDEFLLRGIKIEALSTTRTPIPHPKSILSSTRTSRASRDVNPFIYNPFLRQADKIHENTVLVAGETVTFRLTLQNSFDVEVEVESVRLDAEGAGFESSVASTVLGPYRTQRLRVSGTPRTAGPLKITGAIVKIKGCRERRFPIFSQPWGPELEVKIKAVGLGALDRQIAQPSSLPARPLQPDRVDLDVIPPQPVVVVEHSTLPQSSVMILDGERRTFSVTLRNLSTTTAVDFLLFSFQDSTQEALQAAISSRDASPAELYEFELILARKQALRLAPKRDSEEEDHGGDGSGKTKRYIGPGQTATFDFEMLGKSGLTNALIQVDYAYLGVDTYADLPGDKFFTRQCSLELTVTVNASVEVSRVDVLPLDNGVPEALLLRGGSGADKSPTTTDTLQRAAELADADDEYCLLMLDLRNSWPMSMLVELEVCEPACKNSNSLSSSGGGGGGGDAALPSPLPTTPLSPTANAARAARAEEIILPGHTSRVMVPIKRVFLDNPHAPIPALNPQRHRQFVVSSSRLGPDAERAYREAFWFRERVLAVLRGTWKALAPSSSPSASISSPSGTTIRAAQSSRSSMFYSAISPGGSAPLPPADPSLEQKQQQQEQEQQAQPDQGLGIIGASATPDATPAIAAAAGPLLVERTGTIELRAMRLTARMIEAVRVDEMDIQVEVVGHREQQQQPQPGINGPPSSPAGNDEAKGRNSETIVTTTVGAAGKTAASNRSKLKKNVIFVDEFAQLRVRLTNRTRQPIRPLVRVMPALCHRPLNVALDFTRKLAWNGTLQQVLPLLGPAPRGEEEGEGEEDEDEEGKKGGRGGGIRRRRKRRKEDRDRSNTVEMVVGLTALCRGEFHVTASVEEACLWEEEEEEEEGEGDDNDHDDSSDDQATNQAGEEEDGETGGGDDGGDTAREAQRQKKSERKQLQEQRRREEEEKRRRLNTVALIEDAALGPKERRIWHTRRPCRVIVRDRP